MGGCSHVPGTPIVKSSYIFSIHRVQTRNNVLKKNFSWGCQGLSVNSSLHKGRDTAKTCSSLPRISSRTANNYYNNNNNYNDDNGKIEKKKTETRVKNVSR